MREAATDGDSSLELEKTSIRNNREKEPILQSHAKNEEHRIVGNSHLRTHGISVLTCAFFIVGEMAGSGILSLAKAITSSGWSGVVLLLVFAGIGLYSGILLGKCWIQLRRSGRVLASPRDPYSVIGYECYGRVGKAVVEFCLLATLIGTNVVCLIFVAQNTASLVNRKIGSFTTLEDKTRAWLLIVSAFLLPCTYLGTPKNIWPFAIMATLTTAIASVLIVIKCILDWPKDISNVPKHEVTAESFFMAFGRISFSFGGASTFPTFQADMKDQTKFTSSAVLSFAIALSFYLPTSVLPFIVYGANNNGNVLHTIKHQGSNGRSSYIAIAAEVVFTFHLFCAILIAINPVFQQIEEYLRYPKEFGWKRCLVRTMVFLCLLGIAEAVPEFGAIMSFIGGTTITMMTFILPFVFYMKLNPDLPLYIKVLHVEIVLVAVGIGSIAVYSALLELKRTFLNY